MGILLEEKRMNEDQLPTNTKLTGEDLYQHASDLLDYTDMAHHQPINECVDRFRATFGPVVES